jgi:parallel beta-helix repeat protein
VSHRVGGLWTHTRAKETIHSCECVTPLGEAFTRDLCKCVSCINAFEAAARVPRRTTWGRSHEFHRKCWTSSTQHSRVIAFVVAPLLLVAAACGSGVENPSPKAADSAALSSSSTASTKSRIIRVPEDQPTIAAAMAAARAGDTVKLDPGTYKETLVLKTGVHVVGGPSTIDAIGLEHGIYADTSVTCCASVEQLTVLNSSDNGVALEGARGVRISNCAIRACGVAEGSAGLRMDTDAQAYIETSEFSGSGFSEFRVLNSELTVKNSQVFGNPQDGLSSEGSRTTIQGGVFHDNVAEGVRIANGGMATISGSHFEGNDVGLQIDNIDAAAVPSLAQLEDNVITGNRIGVYVYLGTSGILERNDFENNFTYGALLEHGSSAVLTQNQIRGSPDAAGFVIAGSFLPDQQRSTVKLAKNVFTGNGPGLLIINSDALSDGDQFENDGSGIFAAYGASVEATDGTVLGSTFTGVYASDPAQFCANDDCSSVTDFVVSTVRVSLNHMRVDGNVGDAVTAWGAQVRIGGSSLNGNGTGVNAFSGMDAQLPDGGVQHLDIPGTVTVRNSKVSGNHSWGAIITGGSTLDLGSAGGGFNSVVGNTSGAVANNTLPVATVKAEKNWWGTANPTAIAAMMSGGPVDFVPFLTSSPQ